MPYPDIPVQHLGAFAQGEIPDPILNQFVDNDGVAVPLSGFTITAEIEARPATLGLGTGTLAIVNASEGRVSYTWHANDMGSVGFYRLQLIAAGAGKRYYSDIFSYQVYDGPDTEEAP